MGVLKYDFGVDGIVAYIFMLGVLAGNGGTGRDIQVAEVTIDKLTIAMMRSTIPYELYEAARPSDAVINPDAGGEWLCDTCGMGYKSKPPLCVKCGSSRISRAMKFP